MTTNNYQPTDIDDAISVPPDLSIFTILRLGLFNLGVGLMAVLTLAVLNRVMITETRYPGKYSRWNSCPISACCPHSSVARTTI